MGMLVDDRLTEEDMNMICRVKRHALLSPLGWGGSLLRVMTIKVDDLENPTCKCVMRKANDNGMKKGRGTYEWKPNDNKFTETKDIKDTYYLAVKPVDGEADKVVNTPKIIMGKVYKFDKSKAIDGDDFNEIISKLSGRYKMLNKKGNHLKRERSFRFYCSEDKADFERCVTGKYGSDSRRRLSGFSPQFIDLVEEINAAHAP